MEFKYLFAPLVIGPVTVRNRIVFNSHAGYLGENSMPAEQVRNYHVERTKGGVGLQIMGCIPVHPTGLRRAPGFYDFDDSIIPYYKELAEAIHEYGGKIFVQYFHACLSAEPDESMLPLWAPSAVQAGGSGPVEIPKEMEIEDIEEVIEAFAQAAKRAKEGGLDGVELHFTNTNALLAGCYMSPLTNKRTDKYGGSLENRLRLPMEIIDRVRHTIGNGDVALGIRISGDELLPGGLNQDDMKVIAQKFAETGKIDYINVTIGSRANISLVVPPMAVPLGYQVYLAAGVKEVVNIPVFTVGRINDPVQAEQILADGHADMIGMVRALICDPDLPNKTREGRLDDIRKCIACNQSCLKRIYECRHISCIQNPAAGREGEMGADTIKPASVKKRILVAGGGPAGMEAARIAAIRGHQVILYEKENELGGQVNLAAKAPYQSDFGEVTRYLSSQIKKLGVKMNLGIEVTPGVVGKENPDTVVVATGSIPQRTGFSPLCPEVDILPGVEQENVVTAQDVLRGDADVGQKVVLIDDNGGKEAAGTVELLADKGKKVEVITRFHSIGVDLEITLEQALLLSRLLKKGVAISPYTGVRSIQGKRVTVFNVYSGEERTVDDVDTVVLAMGKTANDSLYHSLKGKVKELYRIGDCVAPRKIDKAIYEGNKVGRIL